MSAQNLKYGAYAGLAGGVVFGVMMGMMGMLPMIGQMVGSSSSVIGFIVHMANSAIIGAAFAVVFGGMVAGVGSGAGYGLGSGGIAYAQCGLSSWAWTTPATGRKPTVRIATTKSLHMNLPPRPLAALVPDTP